MGERGEGDPTHCKVPSLIRCYGNLKSLPNVLLGNLRKLAQGDRILFVFGMSCSFLPTPTEVPVLVTLRWQSLHVGISHDHDQLYCSSRAEGSLYALALSMETRCQHPIQLSTRTDWSFQTRNFTFIFPIGTLAQEKPFAPVHNNSPPQPTALIIQHGPSVFKLMPCDYNRDKKTFLHEFGFNLLTSGSSSPITLSAAHLPSHHIILYTSQYLNSCIFLLHSALCIRWVFGMIPINPDGNRLLRIN